MEVSEGTKIPIEAVEAAFKDFYAYMRDSAHFSGYFQSQAQIDRLVEKQKQSFIQSLSMDEETFAAHYRQLGQFHAEIGVTLEDLIAGLKVIRDKLQEMQVLQADQLYHFIENVENHLAHGYFDYELEKMLQHAELVLKNAPSSLPKELDYVIEWLIALVKGWQHWQGEKIEIGSVGTCPFTQTISRYVSDKNEQVMLHHEHKMQHIMAQSCHHFLEERDYMLANFLLVRLFSISVALFNRLLSAVSMEQLEQAKRDPLTGLRMRHDLDKLLFHVREKSRKLKQGFGVLMLDLDHFKRVNDTYGHDMGDAVLKQVANLLQSMLREDDMLIRYGGEEMLIFLPATTAETVHKVAERIRTAIAQTPVSLNGHSLEVTVSIGCLFVPFEALDKADEALLKHADEYLYQAKHNGRNQVVCTSVSTGFSKGN